MVKSLADIWELVLRALVAPLLTLEDNSFEGDDHRDWLSNTSGRPKLPSTGACWSRDASTCVLAPLAAR
jgi:hypothetical protein